MSNSEELKVISDAVCTQCGCVCDDLTIKVKANRMESFTPDCPLAAPWFESLNHIDHTVVAQIRGQPVDLKTAVERTAELLSVSRSPLIYGLSRSSTQGQRAAVQLGDAVAATIDTTASMCHAPSIMALQYVGENTSTLGEIRNRSDLVIYWGSNPLVSHPRHMERVVEQPGRFVPTGRAGRHVVVVDIQKTESAEQADEFIQLDEGSDFEVLSALRALCRGHDVAAASIGGVLTSQIRRLAERMLSSQYGAVFFGLGLTAGTLGHQNVEALLKLVTELNEKTKFVARRMRILGDVSGADSVLCWQTGYPFSVSLNRSWPRYNPGEFTASNMLERGDVDCVLLVGMQGVEQMSPAVRERLAAVPTILLDYPNADHGFQATVRFNTAIYGVHRPGIVYRMDEVPIPLRSFLSSQLPSDDEVLNAVHQRLQEIPKV